MGRPTLGPPPAIEPRPVLPGTPVRGCRAMVATDTGFDRDLRVMAPPWMDATGQLWVRICHEATWYRWATGGVEPTSDEFRDYPAETVYVE